VKRLFPLFWRLPQQALDSQKRVFSSEHKLLTFVTLPFRNALEFQREYPKGLRGFVALAFKPRDGFLEIVKIVLQEHRLPNKLKQLLEHGAGQPRFRQDYGGFERPSGESQSQFSSYAFGRPAFRGGRQKELPYSSLRPSGGLPLTAP